MKELDELEILSNNINEKIKKIKKTAKNTNTPTVKAIKIIEKMIQSEVDRLNKAKGIEIQDKFSCKLYGDTEGYPYKDECSALWNWSANEVYVKIRDWQKELDHEPTEEEFMEELMKHTFDVTYPEEE